MARAGAEPLALARHTILLPTRRAARALADAFLRAGGGRALLLPRLMPVGDLDADELSLLGDEGEGGESLDIPPAVPELRRRLMLTRLVLAWGRRQGTGPLTPGQAAPLAAELARFLDEVQAEGRDLADLDAAGARRLCRALAERARLPRHPHRALARRRWPRSAASTRPSGATACSRPRRRRGRRAPPADPVIAAGITGGVPAVADLVAAVAALPHGHGRAARPRPRVRCRDLGARSRPIPPIRSISWRGSCVRLELDPAEVRDWPAPMRRRRLAARGAPSCSRRCGRPHRASAGARLAPIAGRRARRAAPARLRRPAGGGAGRSRSCCARSSRLRARPRRWSRPTATSPAASRPSCGAGTSRSTIPPAAA